MFMFFFFFVSKTFMLMQLQSSTVPYSAHCRSRAQRKKLPNLTDISHGNVVRGAH